MADTKIKYSLDSLENRYSVIFEVADYEFDANFAKFDMGNPIWWTSK